MTTRLADTFARCRAENRAALVTYVMAGDPDPDTSLQVLRALPEAGADIVEFGLPFTDPMADGPAIQAAGLRALKIGQTLAGTLELVRRFRAENAGTPVIMMGYYNPIYIYGVARFLDEAMAAGTIPAAYIDALALVPGGCWPMDADGRTDLDAVRRYQQAARSDEVPVQQSPPFKGDKNQEGRNPLKMLMGRNSTTMQREIGVVCHNYESWHDEIISGMGIGLFAGCSIISCGRAIQHL